jgi:signal transduction histidine kinase
MTEEYFKTNVLLKNIVGKDLINDDNIAVLELVKNSYDARAKKVDLYFRNLHPTRSGKLPSPSITKKAKEDGQTANRVQPEILIVDDGSGMNRTDIIDKWLNIAFSEKKYELKKGKRVMAGNKGVGRFSCDRLGRKLDLYTRTHGGDIYHLSVDWKEFEIENEPELEIQEIPVTLVKSNLDKVKSNTGLQHWTKGTVLHITGLRSFWGRDALLKLKGYLERLFNPNQAFEKERFKLRIIAPDFEAYDSEAPKNEKVNGEVTNEVFEKLNFKTTNIESWIDEHGDFITTVLKHDGKEVYRVVEKNEFNQLKNVKVVIYYLNPYKKIYFRKQTGLAPVQFGSIFLFINGFRVPPYGDRGNDWLGLDVRKTQGTTRYIATRDLVGRIEIDDLENRFKIVSSREGIVIDETSEQLNPFYYRAHLRLENFVVQGLNWDSVPEHIKKQLRSSEGAIKWTERTEEYKETQSQKAHRISENLLSVLSTEPEKVVAINLDTELLEQVSSQHRETVDRVLSHFEKYDSKVIGSKLSIALKSLKGIVERQDRQLESLRENVEEKESKIEELKTEVAHRESEILFLKSISTLDQDNLLNLLHQIGLDSSTVKNTVERLLSMIAGNEAIDREFLANALERLSFANRKILTISQFATKANFKFQSQIIKADLVGFVEQYLLNVAKDFTGAGLKLNVESDNAGPFEIKLKPIEIGMVFDNLLSNSKKAGAKEVFVKMSRIAQNSLEISFSDNGRGFSPEVRKVEDIFRKGFTTTSGSGVGLYHVCQILKAINGSIAAAPANGKGVAFTIKVKK